MPLCLLWKKHIHLHVIQLEGMCLHHSFIHLTWRILNPNIFVVRSASSIKRMTVLISINFYRMEDHIFIYRFLLTAICRILDYLKAIHSKNLGIKYRIIRDAGCMTKSNSSVTAVSVDTTSTSAAWDQIFGRRIE